MTFALPPVVKPATWESKIADGTKFEDHEVSAELRTEALAYVKAYKGDFSYLDDMQYQLGKGKTLSTGQIRGVLNCMLAQRRKAQAPAAPVVDGLQAIPALLETALGKQIKYPKIRFEDFILSRCGDKSKHTGAINIMERYAPAYGSGEERLWYGRIEVDGSLVRGKLLTDAMVIQLQELAEDPAKAAAAYGKRSSNCCFCGKYIETNESLAVGYGPVCAANYGLPWGVLEEAVN